MAGDREDELAQTAPAAPGKPASVDLATTATAAPRTPAAEAATVPGTRGAGQTLKTLGRYRIERELGAGGMGIVYAAFDPDLERRVALKLLLTPDGDDAQKQRLLREARAMARLTHPNVVTVHEVGSANGRDYVAMELIEGDSLAEWLRDETRSEDAIISAFLAAGRGLAAAHAAGMVHRDFKPHNVLRSMTGRIAVTDFGLAREAHADPLAATGVMAAPMPGTPAGTSSTPSTPLAGLTMTGSVLGTPAYMAPEQWSGGAVTPATDQFAFCVAAWEALAGERPFRGDTVEMLRRAVELGPAPLDDSKLPRRLRAVLRRGLDPIPSKRWPSMDALLVEMAPPKRPVVAVVIGIAIFAAIAIYLIGGRSSAPATTSLAAAPCPPPALVPPELALGPERSIESAMLAADIERWHAARAKACALEPTLRAQRVTCLDHVMARLDAVKSGIARLDKTALPIDVGRHLIDPVVCEASPRLETASPLMAESTAAAIREEGTHAPYDREKGQALIDRVTKDACASALARMIAARIPEPAVRERHLAEAEQHAERCSDDRVRAEIAIAAAGFALDRTVFGIPKTTKLKVAAAAVERVSQPDLVADLDLLRMVHAARAEDLDEAIEHAERAMKGYAARGRLDRSLGAGISINNLLESRGQADDVKRVRQNLVAWHELATTKLGPKHPTAVNLERRLAAQAFDDGDVAAAQVKLEALRESRPFERSRRIAVRVVDATGNPVAGVTVTVGTTLTGAGTTAAFPTLTAMGAMRVALTSESGEVELEGPREGVAIAQLADRRSRPALIADRVTLVLEPTSRIEGKVDLRGEPAHRVAIGLNDTRNAPTTRYEVVAPVKPDGSFELEGVPRTKVKLFVALQVAGTRALAAKEIVVSAPIVRGIELAVANNRSRSIHVVVRSTVNTPAASAQVFLQSGTVKSTSLDKFDVGGSATIKFAKPPDDKLTGVVTREIRPGDLVATLNAPTSGPVTACALGLPSELDDPEIDRKIRDGLDKIEIRCVPVPPAAEVVVIEVPPWPRLE